MVIEKKKENWCRKEILNRQKSEALLGSNGVTGQEACLGPVHINALREI